MLGALVDLALEFYPAWPQVAEEAIFSCSHVEPDDTLPFELEELVRKEREERRRIGI